MGFMSNVGTFLKHPIDSIDHGFDTTRKADQAGVSGNTIDELEDAGASDKEINAAVSKAQTRHKNALLAEVSGDAPDEDASIGAYPATSNVQSGQDLKTLLTALTAFTTLTAMSQIGSGDMGSESI